MQVMWRQALLMLWLTACTVSPAPVDVADEPAGLSGDSRPLGGAETGTPSVTGMVRLDGRVVADASVEAFAQAAGPQRPGLATRTDAAGAFRLDVPSQS